VLRGPTTSGGPQYLRNRYYDASTGRFTQLDPIGLAGGMNLYGFAGGDPVNFSDPIGLCPEDMGGDGKSRGNRDCPEGSAGRRQYIGGAVNVAPFSPLDIIPIGSVASGIKGMLLGGAEAIEAAAVRVTFGHGARHLAGKGLKSADVETAIAGEVRNILDRSSLTGSWFGRVAVSGQRIEYRAYTLQPRQIHVGTYYPKPQ